HGGGRLVLPHLQRSQPGGAQPEGEGLRQPARGVVPALDALGRRVSVTRGSRARWGEATGRAARALGKTEDGLQVSRTESRTGSNRVFEELCLLVTPDMRRPNDSPLRAGE